jgi:hypothetical protein
MFKESADFDTEDVLTKLGKEEVTGSAFSQARYKIEWQFFSDLCAISSEDYDTFSTARWKAFRVFAGDGSTLNLPASKQIRGYFGLEGSSLKTPPWQGYFLSTTCLQALPCRQDSEG